MNPVDIDYYCYPELLTQDEYETMLAFELFMWEHEHDDSE